MPELISAIRSGAMNLHDGTGGSVRAGVVLERAEKITEELVRVGVHCAGLRMDNGIDWICADLACLVAGIPVVPIPMFFTGAQVAHVVRVAGIDALFGSLSGVQDIFTGFEVCGREAAWSAGPRRDRKVPAGIAKVTFTSGTTGEPRGVCLTLEQQEAVATDLAQRTRALDLRKHLAVLPLAVLLENVAGVYGALLSGADVVLPPLARVGVHGSSGFNPVALLKAVRDLRPDSLILLPQLLKALVAQLKPGTERVNSLKFVPVGGARSAPELILQARALGLPVYEGYGLTEACSVVSMNLSGADRPGSVGRALPSRQVRLSSDNEIEIHVPEGVHYLGQPTIRPGWLPTGDLGAIDKDGYLFVNGRRKQVLITAFGRNVSPEWVESELLTEPAVTQVVVLGNDLPALAALIVPGSGVSAQDIDAAVGRCNGRLPDYARIAAWRAIPPLTAENGQLTLNGRTRRPVVAMTHATLIETLGDEIQARLSLSGNHHDVLPKAHSGY